VSQSQSIDRLTACVRFYTVLVNPYIRSGCTHFRYGRNIPRRTRILIAPSGGELSNVDNAADFHSFQKSD
jgi:hypothetical protein